MLPSILRLEAWFGDYAILGCRGARLYDGSMSKWAQRNDLPRNGVEALYSTP